MPGLTAPDLMKQGGAWPTAAATLRALAARFVKGGTEGLENPEVFQTPKVKRAGGVKALAVLGQPSEVLRETKVRLFAA